MKTLGVIRILCLFCITWFSMEGNSILAQDSPVQSSLEEIKEIGVNELPVLLNSADFSASFLKLSAKKQNNVRQVLAELEYELQKEGNASLLFKDLERFGFNNYSTLLEQVKEINVALVLNNSATNAKINPKSGVALKTHYFPNKEICTHNPFEDNFPRYSEAPQKYYNQISSGTQLKEEKASPEITVLQEREKEAKSKIEEEAIPSVYNYERYFSNTEKDESSINSTNPSITQFSASKLQQESLTIKDEVYEKELQAVREERVKTQMDLFYFENLKKIENFDKSATANIAVNENDSLALVALYNSCNGPNWQNNTNWLSVSPVEDWYGVSLQNGRVRSLSLTGDGEQVFGLSGELPAEIGLLTELEVLLLQYNQLTGSLPLEITNLIHLQWLDLRFNNLGGIIPTDISNLTELRTLNLGGNALTGIIPSGIGQLTNLTELYLFNNQLTGAIPSSIGNLINLKFLQLGSNNLTGSIPEELGQLSNLLNLFLYSNELSGLIPATLGNLGSLTVLNLSRNTLTGAIPPELGQLVNLIELFLDENQLSGSIPYELSDLNEVRWLNLSRNNLTGSIPAELSNMANLEWLYLRDNSLTGEIPVSFGLLIKLKSLDLAYNQLTGIIPPELQNLTLLEYLQLRYQNFNENSFPDWLGNLSNLRYVYLDGCNLTGELPSSISSLSQLELFYCGNNNITGSIPTWLSQISSLRRINLGGNNITGIIPTELSDLTNLYELNLHDNLLTGTVPETILGNLQRLYVNGNKLDHLPDIENCSNLYWFNVSDNNLTFEDLEYNMDIPMALSPWGTELKFYYEPQLKIGDEKYVTLTSGDNYTLSVSCGGTQNQYQWLKDGVVFSDKSSSNSQLLLENVDAPVNGSYVCLITNNLVPDLTIFSEPIHIEYFTPVNTQDSLALVSLYNSCNGAGWKDNTNWLTSAPVSQWYGVTVNEDRVVELRLRGGRNDPFGLTNTLPTEIGNLPLLQILDLAHNDITGNLPIELSNLRELRVLNLFYCDFSGTVPDLGSFPNLKSIDIWGNQFEGGLPDWLGLCPNLESIQLGAGSGFVDNIPETWFALTKLRKLWLANINVQNSQLPIALSNLVNLEQLSFQNMNFEGTIPEEWNSLKKLETIYLTNGNVNGTIPDWFWECPSLTTIALFGNEISGSLSSKVGQLKNLINLRLNRNKLSGIIPKELGGISKLAIIDFGTNQFSGDLPIELSQLSLLREIRVGNNLLDSMPDFSKPKILNELAIENNRLTFEDLEYNMDLREYLQSYWYAPQSKVGEPKWISVNIGEDYTLDVSCGGSQNLYQWFRDGIALGEPIASAEFLLLDISYSNEGTYVCHITNPLVPDLTLYSESIELEIIEPPINSQDSLALVALYNSCNGVNWKDNTNWLTSAPVRDWYGVSVEASRVYALRLQGNYNDRYGLNGQLPSELGDLSNLKVLDLRYNELSGTIPSELGQLSNLEELYLYNNQLSGSIPTELGDLTYLQWLHLNDNQLSGTIPIELGNLLRLNYLFLGVNNLEGNIPDTFSNLINLRYLHLGKNNLTGSIPAGLAQLTELWNLVLYENQLSGDIPPELASLTKLESVSIRLNKLTGTIPLNWFNNVRYLDISYNYFDSLPEITECPNLYDFWIRNNKLTFEDLEYNMDIPMPELDPWGDKSDFVYVPQLKIGKQKLIEMNVGDSIVLSASCGGSENIYQWFFDGVAITEGSEDTTLVVRDFDESKIGNYFCRVTNNLVTDLTIESEPNLLYVAQPPCDELDSLALVSFYNSTDGDNWIDNSNWLSGPVQTWYGVEVKNHRVTSLVFDYNNNLSGTLPDSLYLLDALDTLSIRYNYELSGNISPDVGNLEQLDYFRLYNNNLEGEIPQSLTNLTTLAYLSLRDDGFGSDIFNWVGQITSLEHLYLYSMPFGAEIPSSFNQLQKLQSLYLVESQLSGEVPDYVWDFPHLKRISLAGNQLQGEIPLSITNSDSLMHLYLHSNQFVGEIPEEIFSFPQLKSLNLGDNYLTGILPDSFGNADSLEYIGLYGNQLEGTIPDNIWSIPNLSSLNLRDNSLSGELNSSVSQAKHLRYLYLNNNQFTGNLPTELSSLTNLLGLYAYDNSLSGTLESDLLNTITYLMVFNNHFDSLPEIKNPPNLSYFRVDNNDLSFEDLEYNMDAELANTPWGSPPYFKYDPQNLIGEADTIYVEEGSILNLGIECGGTENNYHWYKGSEVISDLSSSGYYSKVNFTLQDTGSYYCVVKNPLVPDLTLRSHPIQVYLGDGCEQQHFHPVWEGTSGHDHMNINVVNATADGFPLTSYDEVGIFDGDICVGYGKVIETIDNYNILSIVVSRDDGEGNGFTVWNNISYRIWDCSEKTEIQNVTASYLDNDPLWLTVGEFVPGGTAFVELSAASEICVTLDLKAGWNIFSINNNPNLVGIDNVFQPLIDNESLVKIQDEQGQSLENWGIFGGWQNNIGKVACTEGYKVKVKTDRLLEVCGFPAEFPFAIPLHAGWNIIGYPHYNDFNAMEVVAQLIAENNLIKIQDEQGRSIEDWGIFGGWQNNIGNFVPGEGFKVKVSADDTLWIESSYSKSTTVMENPLATIHFKPEYEGKGVDHMNLNLVDLPVALLSPGDELAVFDGNICVGAVTLLPTNISDQRVSIIASSTDSQGMPGFVEGNTFTLKLWKNGENTEYELLPEVRNGYSVFAKHETSVLSLKKYSISGPSELEPFGVTGVRCYPNPFKEEVAIEITLQDDSEVALYVINQLGQKINCLQQEELMLKGTYRYNWNGTNSNHRYVSPGIYYLNIQMNGDVRNKKMVLQK